MARTLATGPVMSRGAMLGQQMGTGLGAGLLTGFQDRQNEMDMVAKYDPVREALAEQLGTVAGGTPGQQMLMQLTQDPLAFAQAMEDPNALRSIAATTQMATGPEEDPVQKAIRFYEQAAIAEAEGNMIRPPALRARANQILGIEPPDPADMPEMDMLVAVTPDGPMPVQRNPETGRFADVNGNPMEIPQGTQIMNIADMQAGESREIRVDAQGVPRYTDTGEEVFPGIEPPEEEDPGDAQAATFAQRAGNANSVLSLEGDKFTGFWSRTAGFVPQGMKSEARQEFDQATNDFITAVLREESGAQINPSEFTDARNIYIPQPGDSEAVLQRKQASRAAAIAGLEVAAGSALEQVRNAPINAKVTLTVNGEEKEYLVGTVITNAKGERGVVQYDGTVQLLE